MLVPHKQPSGQIMLPIRPLYASSDTGDWRHSDMRNRCARVDGLAKRCPNLLFRAAGPAFVEARVLDLDCKVVAGAVAPNSRTGGTLCPPVPAVLARGANIVQDSELRVASSGIGGLMLKNSWQTLIRPGLPTARDLMS